MGCNTFFNKKYFIFSSTRQLYWADALEDRIEVSDFEGRDRKQIFEHTAHPFSVALFESNVYWSNWYNKSIWKIPKRGHHKPEEVRGGLGGALDIRAVSQSRQPYQWSPCMTNNGDCSHLCLFVYTSYICECPDKQDTRNCEKGKIVFRQICENCNLFSQHNDNLTFICNF